MRVQSLVKGEGRCARPVFQFVCYFLSVTVFREGFWKAAGNTLFCG